MMIDLGKKSDSVPSCVKSEDAKDKKYYPGLYIDGKDFDVPKEKFGKDIEIKAIVRVKAVTQRKNEKGELTGSVELEFRKIDFGDHSKDKSIGEAIMDAMDEEDRGDGNPGK
jgi:hypothetical protein